MKYKLCDVGGGFFPTNLISFAFSQKVNGNMWRKNVINQSFVLFSHILHFLLLFVDILLPEKEPTCH